MKGKCIAIDIESIIEKPMYAGFLTFSNEHPRIFIPLLILISILLITVLGFMIHTFIYCSYEIIALILMLSIFFSMLSLLLLFLCPIVSLVRPKYTLTKSKQKLLNRVALSLWVVTIVLLCGQFFNWFFMNLYLSKGQCEWN